MVRGERLNSITHLIGTVLAITGSVVLVTHASAEGDPWKITSFSVFGAMLVLLYAASTLYHSWVGRLKSVFRKLDHAAIFLLIAGSYTPFTLVTLRGWFGWTLFVAIWAMALWGTRQAWRADENADPALWPYVGMGWLGAVAAWPLLHGLGPEGIAWLFAGALLYSGGIVFYRNEHWPHAHGIWHLFVMGGSAAHFVTVLYFVD